MDLFKKTINFFNDVFPLITITSTDHYLFNCYADLSLIILVMAPVGADTSVLQNVINLKKVNNAL